MLSKKNAAFLEACFLSFQYPEVRGIFLLLTTIAFPLLSYFLFYSLFHLLFPQTICLLGWFVIGLAVTKWVSMGNSRGDVESLMKLNLKNKIVIITGAATGIGRENVVEFAKMGATVVFAARGEERCNKIIQEIKQSLAGSNVGSIVHIPLDLSSFESIRSFVKQFRAQFKTLDILINNAGVMMCPWSHTQDGLEMQMGTNHFGHFLLTSLLEDLIRASKGRVVCLASFGHLFASSGLFYEHYTKKENYEPTLVYGQSKMMNVLHAAALNKRLASSGASSYAAHPGFVITELARHVEKDPNAIAARVIKFLLAKTANRGSKTSLYCALSPNAVPGAFHSDCGAISPASYALDMAAADKLWQLSESVCGISSSRS